MSKYPIARALLASAAVVFVAACSNEGLASRISAPSAGPSYDNIGVEGTPSSGQTLVCVAAGSPAGTYSIATSVSGQPAAGVGNVYPATSTTPGNCALVFERTTAASPVSEDQTQVTSIVTAPAGATVTNSTCQLDAGVNDPLDCTEPADATPLVVDDVVFTSYYHGTKVTYTFVGEPPVVTEIPTPLFVIGDTEAHGVGDVVNFWGAQWWKNNTMSGVVSNGVASFKGYASGVTGLCGGTWTSRPGNSSNPPATIGSQIAIIVTSEVRKSGPNISGTIQQILLVDTAPGYEGNPGHAGNGRVVSVACPVAPAP